MTVSSLPPGRVQFLDLNNVPLVGGSVYHYIPGTLTPKTTYEDAAGTIENNNPILLDSIGSAAIWGEGSYRQMVLDADGNVIWDVVTTAPASGTGTLQADNNLSDVDDAETSRTNLGLGTSAVLDTGTSGNKVAKLSGANTWSEAQTMDGALTLSAGGMTQPADPPVPQEIGFLGTPQRFITTNSPLLITDSGCEVFCGATLTVTVPAFASVAFPIGTIVDLVVDQTFVLTLTPAGGVTLRWPVGNVTGSRTVTGPGAITIKLEKTNEWWVRGGLNVT